MKLIIERVLLCCSQWSAPFPGLSFCNLPALNLELFDRCVGMYRHTDISKDKKDWEIPEG